MTPFAAGSWPCSAGARAAPWRHLSLGNRRQLPSTRAPNSDDCLVDRPATIGLARLVVGSPGPPPSEARSAPAGPAAPCCLSVDASAALLPPPGSIRPRPGHTQSLGSRRCGTRVERAEEPHFRQWRHGRNWSPRRHHAKVEHGGGILGSAAAGREKNQTPALGFSAPNRACPLITLPTRARGPDSLSLVVSSCGPGCSPPRRNAGPAGTAAWRAVRNIPPGDPRSRDVSPRTRP
jgi:hypothetical protein